MSKMSQLHAATVRDDLPDDVDWDAPAPRLRSPGPFGAGEYTMTARMSGILGDGPQACVHAADGTVVALCGPAADPQSAADARMFSNAPRLIDVLKAMVERFRLSVEDDRDAGLVEEARRAIRDADGEVGP